MSKTQRSIDLRGNRLSASIDKKIILSQEDSQFLSSERANDQTKKPGNHKYIESDNQLVNTKNDLTETKNDLTETKTTKPEPLTSDVKSRADREIRKRANFFEDPHNMPEPKKEENEQDEEEEEEVGLDFNEPPPEVMEYARREVGETEEVKCQALEELRDMIYERGECLPHRMDDEFLIRFLRARNYNVRHAHRLIVNYVNFKEEHPAIHKNVRPMDLRFIGEQDIILVPGQRTDCGRRMMIFRLGNWDPRKCSVEEIFKATVIVLELGILEPRAQILGGYVIFDFEGISMTHAWSVTPQIASMSIALMVSSFPMKSYGIHVVNQSWAFDAMFKIFKPLLDAKMQEKLYIHGSDMKSLHQHISPNNLPKKYGGTCEEMPYDKWIDSLSKVPYAIRSLHELGYVIPEELLKQLNI